MTKEEVSKQNFYENSVTGLLAYQKEHVGPRGRVFVGSIGDEKTRWSWGEGMHRPFGKEQVTALDMGPDVDSPLCFVNNCAWILIVNKMVE